MLCSYSSSEAVWSAESDVAWLDTSRHVMCLGARVDDLIDRLHGEVECHELADRMQTCQSCTYSQTCEARFRDWCINHSVLSEPIQQALGDFVSAFCKLSDRHTCIERFNNSRAVVLCNLLSKHEHLWILRHLFRHSLIQSIAHRHLLRGARRVASPSHRCCCCGRSCPLYPTASLC